MDDPAGASMISPGVDHTAVENLEIVKPDADTPGADN